MTSDDLLLTLKKAKVKILNESDFCEIISGSNRIERKIRFIALGTEYAIEWWENIMYLTIHENDELKIMFTGIFTTNTWPNSYVLNLQMYNGGECVCVLGANKRGGLGA